MPRRFYQLSADAVTLLHLLWTLLLVGGAVAVFFFPPYAWIQITVMSFTVILNVPFGGKCPLTVFEEKLRQKIDRTYTNEGSYMKTHLKEMWGFDVSVRSVRIITAVGYILSYATCVAVLVGKI